MNPERLIQMANQIGSYFAAEPDRVQAEAEIAGHIKKFWAPTMRQTLIEQVEGGQAEGLEEIVAEAVRTHRDELAPVARSSLP